MVAVGSILPHFFFGFARGRISLPLMMFGGAARLIKYDAHRRLTDQQTFSL